MTNRLTSQSTSRSPIGWSMVASLFLLIAVTTTGRAQSDRSVKWDRYDVTIEVQDDGSFRVTERMVVAFSGEPPFTFGYADIPLGRVEAIDNVSIDEETETGLTSYRQVDTGFDKEPETYLTDRRGSDLHIEYFFTPTTDQTRTFILAYDAVGALRVYRDETPPNEQVWWNAIAREVTDVGEIDAASVTIVLPEPVDPAQVVLGEDTKGPAAEHTSGGQTWTWQRSNLGRGDDFIARMQFPPITQAAAPSWQAEDDQRRADAERERNRRNLLGAVFLGAGLLGFSGGGVWLYRNWYTKGRDPRVGLVAEYLTEPPDDLPPGLVGTLIDEQAQTDDLVATMLDLARRGVLAVEQIDKKKFQLRLLTLDPPAGLLTYERALLDVVFPTGVAGSVTNVTALRTQMGKKASAIQATMYDELVTRGYFDASPKAVRSRWSVAGGGMMVAAFLTITSVTDDLGWPAFVLGFFLGLGGLAVLVTGRAMPRRTLAGAESTARWQAFRRYLKGIEEFQKTAPTANPGELFDRYLPFATALGQDERWVNVFSRDDTPAPRWYVPIGAYGGPDRSSSSGGGGNINMPSVQGMSNSAMNSLSSVSNGMFAFLTSASAAFTPPSSKSGGFSGGGGRGGGGGGGGRGFG